MFRIIRVPLRPRQLFRTHHPHPFAGPWDVRPPVGPGDEHGGRQRVANVYRDLEAPYHRTRFNHFVLVVRGDPAAALRQKAHELRQGLGLQPGTTVYLVIDDSKQAKRGQCGEPGAICGTSSSPGKDRPGSAVGS